MRRILGLSGSLCASAIALLLASGCGQTEGERCQINSDCADGLTCQGEGLSQGNGVCKPANAAATSGKDAAADVSAPRSDVFVAPSVDAESADAPSTPSPDAAAALDTTALDVTPVDTGAID
jgi:hypothetical protein